MASKVVCEMGDKEESRKGLEEREQQEEKNGIRSSM